MAGAPRFLGRLVAVVALCARFPLCGGAGAANSATGSRFSGERVRSYTGPRGPGSWTAEMLPSLGGDCERWGVVTTIYEPSAAIASVAAVSGWCLVIVGDNKTPRDFLLTAGLADRDDVVFLSAAWQRSLTRRDCEDRGDEAQCADAPDACAWEGGVCAYRSFLGAVPFNHFSRKNVGYLYAVQHGARFVFDFDDDNDLKKAPDGSPLPPLPPAVEVAAAKLAVPAGRALNPYPLLRPTEDGAWPRGFPLEDLREFAGASAAPLPPAFDAARVGVYQSVADGDPDVDAVYRLTRRVPFNFTGETIFVAPAGAAAPYNAQATVHAYDALWAALLPRTVAGRVSDIWRSYLAAPIFGRLGLSVAFTPPRVRQVRNAHDYLADMDAEADLYFKGGKLVDFLKEWDGADRHDTVPEIMEALWIAAYERTYVELGDVLLVRRWLAHLTAAGYVFPRLARRRARPHHARPPKTHSDARVS